MVRNSMQYMCKRVYLCGSKEALRTTVAFNDTQVVNTDVTLVLRFRSSSMDGLEHEDKSPAREGQLCELPVQIV